MFHGRKLLIATKHEKEKVIAPILAESLGVTCFVDDQFDTDLYGTFSGEVRRENDALSTLRKKCLQAMEQTHCDLAVASEGSFGPHPSLFFVPADDELIIFIDKKNRLEIIARELDTDTNFNAATVRTEKELRDFATLAQFPTHGLILRTAVDDYSKQEKGITNWEALLQAYTQIVQSTGSVYVETDMRAMYNPSRMKVIEKATRKLVDKINTPCPSCKCPGFEVTTAKPGLPCERCHFPTRSTLAHVYMCQQCTYTEEKKYPHGKRAEDPMYCDVCNP